MAGRRLNCLHQARGFGKNKEFFRDNNIEIESGDLEWVAKETIELSPDLKEKNQKLFDALDEHDDVQNIYTNFNL